MRTIILHICDVCGCNYITPLGAQECEADCLGITVSELEEYEELKDKMKYACSRTTITNNERTRAAEEAAIKAVIEFEKAHNINR